MTDVWVNDRPIEDYGLQASNLAPWWFPVGLRLPANPVPGRRGERITDRGATSVARRIPLVTLLSATTVADRLTKLDAIARDFTGVLEIRVSDDPERVGYGTLESGSLSFFGPQLVGPDVTPTYELVCSDPVKYDRRSQLLVIPNAAIPVAVPCGTVGHRGKLWIMDTLASRAIDVVAGDGSVTSRTRLTGTLAANEYLELDMDRDSPTITHVAGSTRTDAFTWLNPLDGFPVFDPLDRPALRHNGAGALVLSYRRAYNV